jgi:hypothetical protein
MIVNKFCYVAAYAQLAQVMTHLLLGSAVAATGEAPAVRAAAHQLRPVSCTAQVCISLSKLCCA